MRHAVRIAATWVALSLLVELLIAIAPIPAPSGSPEAIGERQTIYMLFYVGAPVFVLVWVLLLYALVVVRRPVEVEEEQPASSNARSILLLWGGLSFMIVIFLAGWGTFTLHEIAAPPHSSVATRDVAGNRGPVTNAAVKPMIVQAIGRQWLWMFRYPAYGGMVTRYLVVPYELPIELHITSIDVVHSLWIRDYGVKEDAVPGVDNTAWFLARSYRRFTRSGSNWVKCNELCGIGHSYMWTGLYVERRSAFSRWATAEERFERSTHLLQRLPRYAAVYYPARPPQWPWPPKARSVPPDRRAPRSP